ncbi:MAG: spore gernimation protein, partial [Paenibacillus sp.]|nr:spore gernimation protein [Paenibacillus sp.]
MVTKETVSSIQMAALLLLYTTGSTIIFIPSSLLPESGNAAWIAWIIAGLFGSLVLSCMLYLCNKHPGDTLVEIGFHAIGRPFTTILLVPFVLFMLLLSAYIYFSVGSFFNTSMMRETPLPVFNGLMALISALTARAGILIMARMFRIINIILVGVIIVVLLLNLENYHPSFLLPILPNGIKPVFHSVYQVGGFIYGDFLVFA